MDVKIQLLALLGVVVGAAMTFLSSNLVERARWQRQQGVRWDERRLDAYVRYAASVKRNSSAVAQILAGSGVVKSIKPVEHTAGLQELAEAEAERSASFEAVLMLGDTATVDAGSKLNREIWRMQAFARGESSVDAQIWHDAFYDYRQARVAFYSKARDSMGVPKATMPATSAWLDAAGKEILSPTM